MERLYDFKVLLSISYLLFLQLFTDQLPSVQHPDLIVLAKVMERPVPDLEVVEKAVSQ
jgi:hypothetical protein